MPSLAFGPGLILLPAGRRCYCAIWGRIDLNDSSVEFISPFPPTLSRLSNSDVIQLLKSPFSIKTGMASKCGLNYQICFNYDCYDVAQGFDRRFHHE